MSDFANSKLGVVSLSVIVVFLLCLCGCGNDVHNAAWKGDVDTVKTWIDKGGDVNDRHSRSGGNILSYAAGSGNTKLVEYLISKGATVGDIDNDGTSPLHYACREGHTKIVALLLSKGANPNVKADKYKRSYGDNLEGTRDFPYEGTPLHWVIGNKLSSDLKLEVVRVLLDYGADPNAMCRTPEGYFTTPITEAKGRGYSAIHELLLQKKAKKKEITPF